MYNNFLTLFQTGGIISADISCCLLYMKGAAWDCCFIQELEQANY